MKRVLFILLGSALLGLVTYFLLGFLADWYGQTHIQSDEDISNVYFVFLCVLGLSIVIGGLAGNLAHKKLTRHSSTH
jgi:MFS family permease